MIVGTRQNVVSFKSGIDEKIRYGVTYCRHTSMVQAFCEYLFNTLFTMS